MNQHPTCFTILSFRLIHLRFVLIRRLYIKANIVHVYIYGMVQNFYFHGIVLEVCIIHRFPLLSRIFHTDVDISIAG